MSPEEAQAIARAEAGVTAARQQGENAGAYYRALRAAKVPPWYAVRLTLGWIQASHALAGMHLLRGGQG